MIKKCFFCQYKIEPDYKDVVNLEKFLSPRKKILGREKTGVCAKHQRKLTKAIKYARYLALIPYVFYQGIK
ncbi:MAG: 30S ribosomal protein S18 [Patescibacteria group bacterium]|nr:30S ribosomal protein S18 [Patescibacteria group bacterium]